MQSAWHACIVKGLSHYTIAYTAGPYCLSQFVHHTHCTMCDDNTERAKFCHEARQLTNEEIAKLLSDTDVVAPFRQQKLEKDAKKNWDLFYKRNLDKFFRDRNWTTREFEELFELDQQMTQQDGGKRLNLLEAGCGVGNFIWPLIKMGLRFNYFACDFSPIALNILRENELYDQSICHAFQADLTESDCLRSKLTGQLFHCVSLIFVLSAIHPSKMSVALQNIHAVRSLFSPLIH